MTSQTMNQGTAQSPGPRLWFLMVLPYFIIPAMLLISGGDPGWWQAWAYSIMLFLAGVVGRVLAEKRHPGILVERVTRGKTTHTRPWDKVLAPMMAISLSFPLVIVAGLDHRYGWANPFSIWFTIAGLVLIAIGYSFSTWALVENAFFSSTVYIQKDRGHFVCDSGPYKILRHPGYAGNLLAVFAMVLALNSLWTLVPALLALVIAVIRTSFEDKMLQEDLAGYSDYVKRVRYRLLNGVY